MCLVIKYICRSCREPISDAPMDEGVACKLSLSTPEQMIDSDNYRDIHTRLQFQEVIPLPFEKALVRGFVCDTTGCAYNPETPTSEGQEDTYGGMARCPGCDHIISTTTTDNELDPDSARTLYRYLGHRADFRVPILARHLWGTYVCNHPQNGCLWSRHIVESTNRRLDEIRAYMSVMPVADEPIPENAPPRQLAPLMPAEPKKDGRKVWSESEEASLRRMKAAGATYKEIGEVLGKKATTVKAKWLRDLDKEKEDELSELRKAGLLRRSGLFF